MQFQRSVGLLVLVMVMVLTGATLCAVLWQNPEWLGVGRDSAQQASWLWATVAVTLTLVLLLLVHWWLWGLTGRLAFYDQPGVDDVNRPAQVGPLPSHQAKITFHVGVIKKHLREYYGWRWQRRMRVMWVIGEAEQVAAVAPGLEEQRWLEWRGTLLLWGGSVHRGLAEDDLTSLQRLRRWRPLNGIVWALTAEQSRDMQAMRAGASYLQQLARALHWQAPLHLWQVCASDWQQTNRSIEPVGCLLPPKMLAADIEAHLQPLLKPLREKGMAQVLQTNSHDFLLRLSRDLQVEGINRWRQALEPLLGKFSRGVTLRGLWFAQPQPSGVKKAAPHILRVDEFWDGVLADSQTQGRRIPASSPASMVDTRPG
jgi:type VI secretion system protein ImpL